MSVPQNEPEEILTVENVRLGAFAADVWDAIWQAGALLVKGGYVAPSYVEGMLAREKIHSTYLGNGIAIPHGRTEDLAAVYHTGLSVLQLTQGVEWEPGEKACLIIGLASRSEEHIGILVNLTSVVQDTQAAKQLAHTSDPVLVVERLTRGLTKGEK